MADLDSKRPLGADDVDLVHSVHRSQDFANESHLGHPYTEHAQKETENSLNEEAPENAQAIRENMRMEKSLGATAMAMAPVSSGAGTVRSARDGQLVPPLKPGKDGDTKGYLLSGVTSTVEGQSHSFKLAPGERIQSLSHLLEDRLSLAAPYTTAPPVERGHLRLKNANQPSIQKSFPPGAPTGYEGRTVSYVKDGKRDPSLHDRGLILKTQIPKKGRPISRHTPSSHSNAKSISAVSRSGCLPPNSTNISGRNTGSWTSSFGMHGHQLPLQSPGGHGMPAVAGQQFSLKSGRVSSRPDRIQVSTSVAPHTYSQLYSAQQSGSFSTLTPKQVHDSSEGSRFTSGISFRPIGPETSPKSATTFAESQFPEEWHSLPQARSSDHPQRTNYASLIHDRSGEVASSPARKYQEVESAFAAGIPISMNSRKRNSSGVEKRQDCTFDSESRIRPHMSSVYDLEKNSDGEGMDSYELREESRRASKRTSRSDLDFTCSSERSSENRAGSHQRRPRSMMLPHGHNDPALQVRDGLAPAVPLHYRAAHGDGERFVADETYSVSTSRFQHSHSRSLDMTCAESLRTSHRPRSMNHPGQPTSSGVGSYLTQRPPHPVFPPATAHPGRPNPSVSLVPKVSAMPVAVPSVPTDCISSSVPSLPAVSTVTEYSLSRCTDYHSHASASSHSLSSSYYPSPTVSNSPQFEPSTDPIPVKTDATFFLFTTALNLLSPSNGSPVSASSQAGGEQAVPVVQGHQDYVLDHKGPTEVTLKADRLAREMSGSSYPTLRGRRATSFGAMRAAAKSNKRKTQGTNLKKHQILQQQLQQLQREQEMDLFRGVRQQMPYQHPDHYPRHSLQQSQRQKEQAPRHPQEFLSALLDNQECYPPEQLLQQQQPRPGRPPKQRVLMRSQSSSAVVFEHSSSASLPPAQIQPSEAQQSRMHHAPETHQPQRRQNQNQRQQQQQQYQHQQPRILLRPVSLPLLAMSSTDPNSPLFLSQPPLSQPRFQSMRVPDLFESTDLPRAYTRVDGTCTSSLNNRFHSQPTARALPSTAIASVGVKSVPSHLDDEVIERLSIRPPVSAP